MSLRLTSDKRHLVAPNEGGVTKHKRERSQEVERPNADVAITRFFKNTGCIVNYYPTFMNNGEAAKWFSSLADNVNWGEERAVVFGKSFVVPRKMAYFGDQSYAYAGSSKKGQGWPGWLTPLKDLVESHLGVTFNYALMNFYKDGTDHIGYHSDDEKDLIRDSVIASLSFGAQRDFMFQRRYAKGYVGKKEPVTKISLRDGSLLTMGGTTQREYKHSLPKRAACKLPRINVTFRIVREAQ